ncbi:MAG: hypothetical protein HY721_22395 [Planctomycetes bacterium]|nr:hypothetical protein [Planctomycetota bacterium]
MTAAARAAFLSAWVLGVGLLAVRLEVEDVRAGVRIRDLMIQRDAKLERFRRLEARFNRRVSPDLLEKDLPEEFREAPGEGGETRAAHERA